MAITELLRRYEAGGGRGGSARVAEATAAPALRTVLLTCMDSRIDVFALFGVEPGEVHVLRNAGGVVTDDVLRSLIISQRRLGTCHVLIVQHTGCGLATLRNDAFREELAVEVGMEPAWNTHAFTEPGVTVRRGMARLRQDPFVLAGTTVRGFVLDVDDFGLVEVE